MHEALCQCKDGGVEGIPDIFASGMHVPHVFLCAADELRYGSTPRMTSTSAPNMKPQVAAKELYIADATCMTFEASPELL
jgi:hypothetical protein